MDSLETKIALSLIYEAYKKDIQIIKKLFVYKNIRVTVSNSDSSQENIYGSIWHNETNTKLGSIAIYSSSFSYSIYEFFDVYKPILADYLQNWSNTFVHLSKKTSLYDDMRAINGTDKTSDFKKENDTITKLKKEENND